MIATMPYVVEPDPGVDFDANLPCSWPDCVAGAGWRFTFHHEADLKPCGAGFFCDSHADRMIEELNQRLDYEELMSRPAIKCRHHGERLVGEVSAA